MPEASLYVHTLVIETDDEAALSHQAAAPGMNLLRQPIQGSPTCTQNVAWETCSSQMGCPWESTWGRIRLRWMLLQTM